MRVASWRAIVMSLLILSLVAGTVALAGPAEAACGQEENIFWGRKSSGGAFQFNLYGVQSYLRITARSLDPSCTDPPYQAGSTVHMRLTMSACDWAEIGWWRKTDGSYELFTEWGENCVVLDGTPHAWSFPGSCPPAAANFDLFKVSYLATQSDWSFQFACQYGGQWQEFDLWTDPSYSTGLPTGETFRFDPDVGMSDHHHDLLARTSSTWLSWPNNGCYEDGTPGWKRLWVAADHYDTVEGAQTC